MYISDMFSTFPSLLAGTSQILVSKFLKAVQKLAFKALWGTCCCGATTFVEVTSGCVTGEISYNSNSKVLEVLAVVFDSDIYDDYDISNLGIDDIESTDMFFEHFFDPDYHEG
jgi:hypothetical protein